MIFRSHGLLQIIQETLRRLRSASVGAGQTSTGRFAPLRWLPPAILLWTCHLGTPCAASCSHLTSFITVSYTHLHALRRQRAAQAVVGVEHGDGVLGIGADALDAVLDLSLIHIYI